METDARKHRNYEGSPSLEKFWFEDLPFTLGGVRANVQPKSSIPIGAKVEIKSRALH
jgi:hypothetical protein